VNRVVSSTFVVVTLLWLAAAARGDGGFIHLQTSALDLAQTRQEVVLVLQELPPDSQLPRATYVLRSRYTGTPSDFAWVIPVPDTPTDVVAHETDALFKSLDAETAPSFSIIQSMGGGGCSCGAGGVASEVNGLVQVESRGTTGVFDWVALSSNGSDALLAWLSDNGFEVGVDAAPILDKYIQQESHFLAVKIHEPQTLGDQGEVEIPPIQFSCQTTKSYYPMAISQISAAQETEVVIYVLADHRMEGQNVPNALISPSALEFDATNPSMTNYETLFRQTIESNGGLALITEFAGSTQNRPLWNVDDWPAAPPGASDLPFLTRMRSIISRERLDLDFDFQAAESDTEINSAFFIVASAQHAAFAIGQIFALALMLGAARTAFRTWGHKQRRGRSEAPGRH
jgi:hypothetical protein